MKNSHGYILLDAIMTLCLLSMGVGMALTAYHHLMQFHQQSYFASLAYLYADSGIALARADAFQSEAYHRWQKDIAAHLPQGQGMIQQTKPDIVLSVSFMDPISHSRVSVP